MSQGTESENKKIQHFPRQIPAESCKIRPPRNKILRPKETLREKCVLRVRSYRATDCRDEGGSPSGLRLGKAQSSGARSGAKLERRLVTMSGTCCRRRTVLLPCSPREAGRVRPARKTEAQILSRCTNSSKVVLVISDIGEARN
jgi:hypothetical protein